MSCEHCKEPDKAGNYDPCCNSGNGKCEGDRLTMMCIHCGAEMFIEGGHWFHHSQSDIPLKNRRWQYGN
jgi:hypothetical protein